MQEVIKKAINFAGFMEANWGIQNDFRKETLSVRKFKGARSNKRKQLILQALRNETRLPKGKTVCEKWKNVQNKK